MEELELRKIDDNQGRYHKKLDKYGEVYTVEEWEQVVKDDWINNFDGSGYWVKNRFKSTDEVFSTPKLDATHVVWYNK